MQDHHNLLSRGFPSEGFPILESYGTLAGLFDAEDDAEKAKRP